MAFCVVDTQYGRTPATRAQNTDELPAQPQARGHSRGMSNDKPVRDWKALRRWDELRDYVIQMAHWMGLVDYRLIVRRTTLDTCIASCRTQQTMRQAIISFHDRFWTDYTPETQRMVVCHELLHVHLKEVQDLVYERGGKDEVERAVDAMARSWSVHFRLPPWAYEAEEGDDV